MKWFVVFHLMNPITNSFTIDTMFVPNEQYAIEFKTKLETSSIYLNADPRKKGWIEIGKIPVAKEE